MMASRFSWIALGLPGQVDDERLAADTGSGAGEHGVRGDAQALEQHGHGERRHGAVNDRVGGFGRDVARRQPGAAGGEDQIKAFVVGPGDQGGRNLLPVVGNDLVLGHLGAGDTVEHQIVDGGAADIGSFAAGAAITTGQDADGDAGALLAMTVPVSFVGVFSSHAFLLPPGRVPCCG